MWPTLIILYVIFRIAVCELIFNILCRQRENMLSGWHYNDIRILLLLPFLRKR